MKCYGQYRNFELTYPEIFRKVPEVIDLIEPRGINVVQQLVRRWKPRGDESSLRK